MSYDLDNNVRHISVSFSDGGIGDCIARMVPINFIEHYYKNVIVHLWVPVFFKEYAKRCITTKRVIVRDFTEAAKHWKAGLPNYMYGNFIDPTTKKPTNRVNNLSMHMVDHAFMHLNFMPIRAADKNYPKIKLDDVFLKSDIRRQLPERYAVVATGFTAEVREMLPQHVNGVCNHLLSRGITPVFLGKAAVPNGVGHIITPTFREEIDFSKGIDLREKTTLVETAKVVEGSVMVVGLDCGLHHVAGCTEVPIVMGFSSLFKEHRLPYRHGVLGWNCFPVELTDEENRKRGFQSKGPFSYHRNFTQFVDDEERKILEQLDASRYIEQINKILDKS